ncbi:MAG TPA: APC family permease [Acidimicrobiia bacterium]|nr:APC family permease [Acidimicrobiia bacterium]
MSSEKGEVLQREVGLAGAVLLGLGSIVGTGVFVSLGLAVGLAGSAVLWAVAVAAGVALCNGLSSAQLAASNPVSGGTYEYGYRYLHPAAGFTAGWLFLVAKSASAATAALGIASYAGVGAERLPALVALVAVTGLVLVGIRRSNQTNALVVTLAVGSLTVLAVAAWPEAITAPSGGPGDFPSVAEAAALVFVAFTGYGRVATLGEEMHSPRRTIPRAVAATLAVTALLYLGIAFILSRLGPDGVGQGSPLIPVAEGVAGTPLSGLVRVGALAAMVGVLLNLILGLSRVALAMGRRGDLPIILARVHRQGRTPTPAILAVAGVVAAFVLVGDIETTWSFSALTVLVYYALTNLAALRQPPTERRVPVLVQVVGLLGCLGLAIFVDPLMWLWGLGLVAVGLAWHLAARRRALADGRNPLA